MINLHERMLPTSPGDADEGKEEEEENILDRHYFLLRFPPNFTSIQ